MSQYLSIHDRGLTTPSLSNLDARRLFAFQMLALLAGAADFHDPLASTDAVGDGRRVRVAQHLAIGPTSAAWRNFGVGDLVGVRVRGDGE